MEVLKPKTEAGQNIFDKFVGLSNQIFYDLYYIINDENDKPIITGKRSFGNVYVCMLKTEYNEKKEKG